ncbi:serine/threonine-protein kinase Chk2 [Leptodontidium sp. MPI-SDFR-AT-0119]|nr:serine/threonine-protein kinase Chk2 [Leptodontidium sp. MPI-SDFR-AT-0119]
MAFDISQLLDRLGLSHYQQRLADNGFDSLECLYGITEHDFETLDIECGDRRTLQQELRKREAQNTSRETSATVSNDKSAVALRHPELEPTRRSEPEAWGYLTNPSDSFSPTILLHKKRPSVTPSPPSNIDRHATDTEQGRSQNNGSTGGYLIGRHLESDIIVVMPSISNRHCVIFWVNNSTGGMAVVEDLSANGTAVNGVIVGRNNLLELRDNDKVRVADEAHFLFRYSTHNTPRFEQHYTMRDAVGKGHFATVRSCTKRTTTVVYAVKMVKKDDKDSIKELALRREIGLLMSVCHPEIILLQDAFEDSDNIFLVLEFASEGELFRHIATGGKLAEDVGRKIAVQILQALHYLESTSYGDHKRHITHRDIKLENILVMDKSYRVKLADFGLAEVIGEHAYTTGLFGTPTYMPPEILEGSGRRKYTSSVDVWSLGVVLYICLCGFPPFSDDLRTNENPFGLFDQIRQGRFDYPSPYWDHIKDPALEFLDKMLTVNVASRIKVDEAMLHPWISGVEGSILSDLHAAGISRPTFFTRRSAQDRTLLTEAFHVEQ